MSIVKKSVTRDAVDLNVGSDVYEALDDRVMELLSRAEKRAAANGRSTLKARDL